MLLPGTFLGVWNLFAISSRRAPDSISAAWVQAHGHAQIFGWIRTSPSASASIPFQGFHPSVSQPWNWPRSYGVASHQPDHAPSFLGDDHTHCTPHRTVGLAAHPALMYSAFAYPIRLPVEPAAETAGITDCRVGLNAKPGGMPQGSIFCTLARQKHTCSAAASLFRKANSLVQLPKASTNFLALRLPHCPSSSGRR